jgi:ribonuclease E
MKRLLFESTDQYGLRIALAEDDTLIALMADTGETGQCVGNIYKAGISHVEPGLEICIVDYGRERDGILPFAAMLPGQVPAVPVFGTGLQRSEPVPAPKESEPRNPSRGFFSRIGHTLARAFRGDDRAAGDANPPPVPQRQEQEVLVQVVEDEHGEKAATLSTAIKLTGRYLVLMPRPAPGATSNAPERDTTLSHLKVPTGMRVHARPAASGRDTSELQWDLNYLLKLWDAIASAAASLKGANLIYLEASPVIRAIRDYYASDIAEILVDTDEIFEQVQTFMSLLMPEAEERVKRYDGSAPLFASFRLQPQIVAATKLQTSPASAPGMMLPRSVEANIPPSLGEDGIYPGYPLQ